jgi:hypothetical protein
MKTRLFVLPALALAACGPAKTTPDAGVDSSCGIDCAAQADYGLLPQTCFEYSTSNTASTPPALGVQVGKVETLEGGLQVMPVTYKVGGSIQQQDYFTVRDGALVLVRRTWLPGQSASYQDDTGALVGVTWLGADQGVGENVRNSVRVRLISGGTEKVEATQYNVGILQPSALELQTPKETYTAGLKLLLDEIPAHASSDTRRVLVRGTGFTLIASPLSYDGSTATEFKLQSVRTLADGSYDCG